MTRSTDGSTISRGARFGVVLGLLASSLVAASASAAPTITREMNIHFSRSQHYDANPGCFDAIAVTEVQEGNGHLIIVDAGTWLNVTAHETHTITVIPDDPTIATTTRQVTAEFHFRAQPDGDVIYHESFHDFGPAPWDPDAKIRFLGTYITRDGEVVVDHSMSFDEPPAGC